MGLQRAGRFRGRPGAAPWDAPGSGWTGSALRDATRALDALADKLDRVGRSRPFILALSATVFLFVYAQAALHLFTKDPIRDSYSYYFASVALSRGLDPYDPAILSSLATNVPGTVFPYLYPPLLAEMWRPLTLMTPNGSHQFMMIVSTVLAALNAFLLWKLFPKTRRAGAWLIGFILLHAVCGPLVSSVRLGQINVFLGTLIFGALLLERRDRPWGAGLLLALAILIKIVAVAFLVDLVARRRGKTLLAVSIGGVALTLASMTTVGWAPWAAFFGLAAKPMPFIPPLSLRSLIESAVGPWGLSQATVQLMSVFLGIALGIELLPRLLRAWRDRSDPAESWSLILLYSLLVFPLTWHHHYYLALLPFGFLVFSANRPASRAAAVALALAVLFRYPRQLHLLKPIGAAIALYLPWGSPPAQTKRIGPTDPAPLAARLEATASSRVEV